jgi:hypothetical protein
MTSEAQDLQGELQKRTQALANIMLTCTSPSPPGLPHRLQSRLVLSLMATAKHDVLPSRARAPRCRSAICRSSVPQLTNSQDTYRAVDFALSKNRQTAWRALD